MTRPIEDVFEYEGVQLKVVEHKDCRGCYFKCRGCMARNISILGKCGPRTRSDKQSVIFVKTSQEHTPLISIKKKSIILNFK